MARHSKIARIIRLRVQAEEQAQQRLAAAQAKHREAQLQQINLQEMVGNYRSDYLTHESVSAAQMDRFTHFYGRLSQALSAQAGLVNALLGEVEQARALYLNAYRARRGLEKLLEKREQRHKIELLRRERRQTQARRPTIV